MMTSFTQTKWLACSFWSSIFFSIFLISPCTTSGQTNPDKKKIFVASYYFANYHTGDPRNTITKGENWSEWELVKNAHPRFPAHDQPKVPLWGFTDEKDPQVMQQKISTATHYGIDCFIFDWYMYEDGPFLNQCLDDGFLKASNTDSIQFALMWANHDWIDIQPYTRGKKQNVLYPGQVTPQRFEEIGDLLIENYFKKSNYWKIDGKPYFSIYDIQKFIDSFGTLEATRKAIQRLNKKAVKAGLKGIHWNVVAWGRPILPVEKVPADFPQLIQELGFDSATSYVWVHHSPLPNRETSYNWVRDQYFTFWDKVIQSYKVPYYPNVTMGWDPSPRCDPHSEWGNYGYPFTNTIGDNTPQNFETALKLTRDRLLALPGAPRILNLNCWNEWTEGSYLEPDIKHRYGYLEAVRNVFSPYKRTAH